MTQTDTKPRDWGDLKRFAEGLSGREWYVLGPPWAGFTETFTILRGSPDPHVGVAILETVPNDEADETDDHYEQEALAKWLQHADPNAVLELIAEVQTLRGNQSHLEELETALRAEILALKSQRDEMAEDAEKWRALMSCERIRIMGRTLDYKHMGVEFWAKHRVAHPSAEFPQDECRAHLEEFVDRIRRARSSLNKTGGKTDG